VCWWDENTETLPVFDNAIMPFEVIFGIVGSKSGKSITEDLHLLRICARVSDSGETNVEGTDKVILDHEE
jgi:hypothetical protein